MVEDLITQALSSWLTRAIHFDAKSQLALTQLNGKLFLLRCSRPVIAYYISIEDSQINFEKYIDPKHSSENTSLDDIQQRIPDAVLEGSASQLLFLLQSKEPVAALSSPHIELRGDFAAFELFLSLFKQLQPDYEAQLAKVIGDIPAHGVGKFFRNLIKQGSNSSSALSEQAKRTVFSNTSYTPSKDELDTFQLEVHTLQQDAERLEAKINQLKTSS